jgi:hypothetical protein
MLNSRKTPGGRYPGVARTGWDYKNEETQLLEGMACPEGIEPPTHSLEGCCSIQLSYGQRSRERSGRGERIRTFDPLVPNQMRYQAALRPDTGIVMVHASVFDQDHGWDASFLGTDSPQAKYPTKMVYSYP